MAKYDVRAFRHKTGQFKQLPASSIISWIERNFKFKTRKNGTEYCINSPFDDDTGFNFNINPESGRCHDWRDDSWAGPINPETGKRNCSFIKFVRQYLNCSYREAVEQVLLAPDAVSEFLRPGVREAPEEAKKTISVTLPEGVQHLGPAEDTQAKMLKTWLKSRGYTDSGIVKAELYYLAMDVYWPYYEFDTLVYWQSRSRLNKRFNFPALQQFDRAGNLLGETDGTKGDFFYGFDDAEIASYVIITEAIFGQYTVGEQALASGGAILSDTQINKLKILGPRNGVILAPDNDKAGLKSVITNCSKLKPAGFKVFYTTPPKIKYIKDGEEKFSSDWNELLQFCGMSRKEIRDVLNRGIKPVTPAELVKLRQQTN